MRVRAGLMLVIAEKERFGIGFTDDHIENQIAVSIWQPSFELNARLLKLTRDFGVDGVDALPFRLGDRPPAGASVVSLLVGDAPYAQVFVPESQRASVQQGVRFSVHVHGVAQAFTATLKRIRSEASFTPYYALSGDDASRLTYRADLFLDGDAARKLPAGVPCQATRLAAQ